MERCLIKIKIKVDRRDKDLEGKKMEFEEKFQDEFYKLGEHFS